MAAFGRKSLAFLLAAALVFSLIGTAAAADPRPNGPAHAPFWDTYGTQYQAPVDALYALGIVSGESENYYAPGKGVTRAQMAALVVRALNQQAGTVEGKPFPDVPANHWAAGQIAVAARLGIIRGGEDGLFRPNDPVTYPQVVAMIIRALGLESQAGQYPIGYVMLSQQLGLIQGLDRWGLDKPAPRGDVAIMLYRAVFEVQQGGKGPTLSQAFFKKPGSIEVGPVTNALQAGSTQLTARVLDWAGKQLDLTPTWTVLSGGATVDHAGRLTITGDSAVTVSAAIGTVTASQTYQVIKSLVVTADKTAVAVGTQVQLSAVGRTAAGQDVPVTPTWSVVSGQGTVTPAGLLTVTGSSAVKVRATVGSLTADQTVNVVGGITITPATVVVGANQEVRFTATVTDAAGRTVSAPLTWSVTGGGTIDQTGKYRAGSTPATVTVTAGEFTATASVKVIGRIEVSPASSALRKGEAQAFTATVYSSDNQPVPNAQVTWDAQPRSVGFISDAGRFFAADPGSAVVTATYGGLTARVPVTVAGQATGLQLTAAPTTLPANGSSTTTITARLVDANGATATGAETVMFSMNNANLGTLDKIQAKVENGYATVTLTVGTTAGTYSILASAPGTSLPTAMLAFSTTVPAVSHIALEVYPNPLAADGVSQTTVKATLIDTSGAPMPNKTGSVITVSLYPNNTAAGQLNNSMIQIGLNQNSGSTILRASSVPGVTVISGNAIYPVRPVTVTSQVVGGAYQLKFRSATTTTAKADGTSELVLQVEVQDANGNVRTGDNAVVVGISAVADNGDRISVGAQQSQWGVATFRLRTNKANTYKVSVWGMNNTAIQGANMDVTFTAGNPHKLQLTVEPSTSLAADGVTTATLKAKILDIANNPVNTAVNQVRFIRDSGSAGVTTMPSVTSVVATNGVATLTITSTAGTGIDYYHVEADNLVASPAVSITTRITGVPVRAAVQYVSQNTVPVGTAATVQVWIMDQLNQLVTGDNGRAVTLIATNGAIVTPTTATTVGGIASFTVQTTKSGGVGLTATAVGVANDTVGRVLNVAPGTADHIALSATPEALSADGASRSYIKAELVDAYGNVTNGSYAVNLTLSTPNYLNLPTTTVLTGNQVQVTAKTNPGSTVISGTSTSGYPVLPLTLNTYRPGTPTRVVIDQVQTIQAGNTLSNQVVVKGRVLDENGNLATSLTTGGNVSAMALEISGSAGNNSTSVTNNYPSGLSAYNIYANGVTVGSAYVQNGMATFTLTNTRAETVTLTPIVYYLGNRLQSVPGTFTTTAGPAARLAVSASAAAVVASTPTTVTVTAQATDIYGNPTPIANDTITFTSNNSSFFSTPAPNTVNTSSGVATITLTSKVLSYGGTTVISAVSSKLNMSGSTAIVTDLMPEKPTVFPRDSSGGDSIVSGGDPAARITVMAPARNSVQQVYLYVNGVVVQFYTDISFTTLVEGIPTGGNSITGFVKRADLGGIGTKDIRAVVQTPLGTSPLSDGATLTVQY